MSRLEDGNGSRRLGEFHFLSIFCAVIFYLVLSDLCEDRPSCSVLASPETFTENPCMGTSKYLEVHYKCSPNDFEELTVCEGEDMDIGCHQGNRIAVFAAMFGRKPNGTAHCPPYKQGYIDCQATGTISEVRNRCHSRKRCSLLANASVFGDPCAAGIHKYLTVSYACVPKKYLKQLHRKSGRRKKKKRRRKKKKKKKKKRKGLDKLLPDVTTPSTTRLMSESPFDNLYETYEREEITHAGRRPPLGETSTADFVLTNIFSSSESTEETTLEISTQGNHTFASSTKSPLITTSYHDAHRLPESTDEAQYSSEETSPNSQTTTVSAEMPESETQGVLPTNQIMSTTVNPKFVTKEDSIHENATSVGKYDIVTDNRDGEEITSHTPSQSTTDENTSLEIDTEGRLSSVHEDLTHGNLKKESNIENGKHSYGESEEYDRDNNYGLVRDNFSSERTSVASNPTTLDQHPTDRDDIIRNNVRKHGGTADDRDKVTDQKPVLVVERNLTVLCPNNSEVPTDIRWRGRQRPRDVRTIGFLEDWFSTWYFLQQHEEKAWLYFTLGVCFGIIVLLIIILIKVCISFRRNIRARLDVSEPTHRSAHINNHSSLDAPMLEHSDSIDRIEFVQFHPRGTLRSMRSSNSHNRDIVNYYG